MKINCYQQHFSDVLEYWNSGAKRRIKKLSIDIFAAKWNLPTDILLEDIQVVVTEVRV